MSQESMAPDQDVMEDTSVSYDDAVADDAVADHELEEDELEVDDEMEEEDDEMGLAIRRALNSQRR